MKHVLIAVDLQNDFINMALGTPEAQAIVPNAVKCILDPHYDTVIATMDTHTYDYLDTYEGQHLPVVHCVKSTEGWQLARPVKEALGKRNAAVIEKPTFGSTELMEMLVEGEPESITLIGLCTDICVISNALLLHAAMYETPIYVIEDACAGVTVQKHKDALSVMESCQITILRGEEK